MRPDRRGGHQPAGHRTGGQQTAGRWTGGHQRAGHRTGGQQRAGPPDTRTTNPGDRTPDGWNHTAEPPDPGTTNPDGGHPMLDTDGDRRRGWRPGSRPGRRGPTAGCRLDASPGRRRLGEYQPRTARQQGLRGHHAATDRPGHRRDRQLQVLCRRPAGASAHCSPRNDSGRE
jgi:hypothetical protein